MDSTTIGRRILAYREARGLSLEAMEERTGLDRTFLEAVEHGGVTPAVGPLVKISRALGVRLGTFMDDQITEDPCITRRAEAVPGSGVQASGIKSAAMTYHPLAPGKADRNMEPLFIALDPEGEAPQMSSHEGEEFVIVVSGEVVLRYGDQVHTLGPGDSAYYNSVVPHHVGAKAPDAAQIYAVVYVPF